MRKGEKGAHEEKKRKGAQEEGDELEEGAVWLS